MSAYPNSHSATTPTAIAAIAHAVVRPTSFNRISDCSSRAWERELASQARPLVPQRSGREARAGRGSVCAWGASCGHWKGRRRLRPQKSTDIRRRVRTNLSAAALARSASCFGTSPTRLSPTLKAAIRAPAAASCAARAMSRGGSCARSANGCLNRKIEFSSGREAGHNTGAMIRPLRPPISRSAP